jgi:hypothetical protein
MVAHLLRTAVSTIAPAYINLIADPGRMQAFSSAAGVECSEDFFFLRIYTLQ